MAAAEVGRRVFTALEAVGDFARRASLKDEIGRPSFARVGRPTPVDLSGVLAAENRETADPVRTPTYSELALRLPLGLRHGAGAGKSEKGKRSGRPRRNIAKDHERNLDRILQIENKIDKMAGEERAHAHNFLAHRTTLREQVVLKLRSVVDAGRWAWPLTDSRPETKVVVSCSSAEDAKRLRAAQDAGADLRSQTRKRLPTVWLSRTSLRVHRRDVVRSLRTQTKHIAEGLDWDKQRARCAIEMHEMTLSATGARGHPSYQRAHESRLRMRGATAAPGLGSVPWCSARAAWSSGHGKRYCKDVSDKCHCGGTTWLQNARPGRGEPPRCIMRKGRL
ncbi:hypothetical protein EVAR_9235_1 [Eumeta japonica]|uniref:Uncharacterized protein n=1 Tax=Eumeta variegata TaxID=151549 RepID=A0A4C2AC59_EUMVA|nr:hypothetical protein EVAR_9235_1 [Eumeta japonica]